jgi:hypothetical protein
MLVRILIACLLMASLSSCGGTVAPPVSQEASQAQPSAPPTPSALAATEVPVMPDPTSPPSPEPSSTPTPQPTSTPSPTPSPTSQPTSQPAAQPSPTRQMSASTAPIVQESTADALPPNAVSVPRPLGPAITAMVDGARADLALRQGVQVDAVGLVDVWTVVWPNRGLGCPDPNMGYPDVPADGLLIRLSIGEQHFDYHTDGVRAPFLCLNKRPAPPLNAPPAAKPDAPTAAPGEATKPGEMAPPPGNP